MYARQNSRAMSCGQSRLDNMEDPTYAQGEDEDEDCVIDEDEEDPRHNFGCKCVECEDQPILGEG